ncbi:mycodextranase [Pedobacter miscanthi]|uniref:Mycodextranase n=2 Tax=Pedobacter miscanthi TaxID=2259170 RepID=A0A366L1X0_9SPHI|nr:mycodextranase [Pedobacter miscanthi]
MKKNYLALIFIFGLLLLISMATRVSAQGATTPFKSIEAESGTLAGGATIRTMTTLPSQPTPELEASGRSFVELNSTGESVSWVNDTGISANTIVIRGSIPDAPTGFGIDASVNLYIDGVFRQAITMTSKYSWQYGVAQNWNINDPSAGTPHRFYDEFRAWITGAAIAPGSTITLKKDAANTAAFYYIDMFDLENVGAPRTQPANTLSVMDYGATSGDATDDSDAFLACIDDCERLKKGMWIPVGNFKTSKAIDASEITISGAGMWYTTLQRIIGGRHKWSLTNCTIRDVYIFGNETGRDLAHGHDYGMTVQGSAGWLVERVWVHNVGAGFWCSGTDGTIKDCRASNDWADGINLNNGSSVQANNAGLRLTCQNNYVRGCADDGIAINAGNGGGTAGNMVDTKILNNSSIATIYANGIRVAGGRNSLLQNNLITDNADLSGIVLSTFGVDANPCESVTVKNNLLIRCGGFRSAAQGAIFINDGTTGVVQENTIIDCFANKAIAIKKFNVTLTSNIVINPAATGFYIMSGATGSAVINYNTVTQLKSGQTAFKNDGTATFPSPSLTGNSWQQTATEVSFFQNTNYGGTAGQAMPVGNYTQAQLASKGVANDWASSARVPSGRRVIMYSGDNFTGTSWILTYDTPVFLNLSPNANDQMSSCKVETAPSQLAFNTFAANSNAERITPPETVTGTGIMIYPNPVSATLNIWGLKESSNVVIRDFRTGNVVLKAKTSGAVDVSKLSSGYYFINIGKDKGIKFIKD